MRLLQLLRWSTMLPSFVSSAPLQVREDFGSFVDTIDINRDVPEIPDYRIHDCVDEHRRFIHHTLKDVYRLLEVALRATDDRLKEDSVVGLNLLNNNVNFTSAQADTLFYRWFGKAPQPGIKYKSSRKQAVEQVFARYQRVYTSPSVGFYCHPTNRCKDITGGAVNEDDLDVTSCLSVEMDGSQNILLAPWFFHAATLKQTLKRSKDVASSEVMPAAYQILKLLVGGENVLDQQGKSAEQIYGPELIDCVYRAGEGKTADDMWFATQYAAQSCPGILNYNAEGFAGFALEIAEAAFRVRVICRPRLLDLVGRDQVLLATSHVFVLGRVIAAARASSAIRRL